MSTSPEAKALSEIHAEYGDRSAEWFDSNGVLVRVRGRVVFRRALGKAMFLSIDDGSGELMLFLWREELGAQWEALADMRIGEILAGAGQLFRTKTRRLCVRANEVTVDP